MKANKAQKQRDEISKVDVAGGKSVRRHTLLFSMVLLVYVLVALCHIIYLATPYWMNVSLKGMGTEGYEKLQMFLGPDHKDSKDIGLVYENHPVIFQPTIPFDGKLTKESKVDAIQDKTGGLPFQGPGTERNPLAGDKNNVNLENLAANIVEIMQKPTSGYEAIHGTQQGSLILVAIAIAMSCFCIIIMVLKEYHPSVAQATSKVNDAVFSVISLILIAVAFALIGLQDSAVGIFNKNSQTSLLPVSLIAKIGANVVLPAMTILFLFGAIVVHYLTCTDQIVDVFDGEQKAEAVLTAASTSSAPLPAGAILATNTILPSQSSV